MNTQVDENKKSTGVTWDYDGNTAQNEIDNIHHHITDAQAEEAGENLGTGPVDGGSEAVNWDYESSVTTGKYDSFKEEIKEKGPQNGPIYGFDTNSYYSSLSTAMNKSRDIILLDNIIYDLRNAYYYAAWIKQDSKLDLNGFKVDGNFAYGNFVVEGGKVTLCDSSNEKNGLINNRYASAYSGIFYQGENSELVIEDGVSVKSINDCIYFFKSGCKLIVNNGKVTSINGTGVYAKVGEIIVNDGIIEGANYGCSLFDGAKLTLNEGTIQTANGGYAITNNGQETIGTTITINGGKVLSPNKTYAGTAIYHAGIGTLNINGGEIIGGNTGIEMRAGTLNVTGGKIVGEGIPTGSEGNGNGATTEGAGISIAQHTTKKEITVNISGGKIVGFTPLYESNPQNNSPEDLSKISVSITGGEFLFNNVLAGPYCIYLTDIEPTICENYILDEGGLIHDSSDDGQ